MSEQRQRDRRQNVEALFGLAQPPRPTLQLQDDARDQTAPAHLGHVHADRIHPQDGVTPAMQLGVTDHIWTIAELIDAALTGNLDEPQGKRVGRFHVIDGGVS